MALPDNDDELVLLHNPRCSKSRQAKELLEQRGVGFSARLYLEQPLARDELADLRERLGRPAAEWTRKGQTEYAEAGLGPEADEAALLDAMAAAPILMERPILVRGRRAVVGRPPEDVLGLL